MIRRRTLRDFVAVALPRVSPGRRRMYRLYSAARSGAFACPLGDYEGLRRIRSFLERPGATVTFARIVRGQVAFRVVEGGAQ